MWPTDLRKENNGRGGTWVLHFQDEAIRISLATSSAQIQDRRMGFGFTVDKDEIPEAWEKQGHMDPVLVLKKLHEVICRHMTPELLKEMIVRFKGDAVRAFREGESSARMKMREVLGINIGSYTEY